jgi:hypothetical protein
MATKDPGVVHRMEPDVVHPMDPTWLKSFLSEANLNRQTISFIITAVKKYNKAIKNAGNEFEKDLKNGLIMSVKAKKPSPKK